MSVVLLGIFRLFYDCFDSMEQSHSDLQAASGSANRHQIEALDTDCTVWGTLVTILGNPNDDRHNRNLGSIFRWVSFKVLIRECYGEDFTLV
jgi:flagellar biosynthesis regulator FlaF